MKLLPYALYLDLPEVLKYDQYLQAYHAKTYFQGFLIPVDVCLSLQMNHQYSYWLYCVSLLLVWYCTCGLKETPLLYQEELLSDCIPSSKIKIVQFFP